MNKFFRSLSMVAVVLLGLSLFSTSVTATASWTQRLSKLFISSSSISTHKHFNVADADNGSSNGNQTSTNTVKLSVDLPTPFDWAYFKSSAIDHPSFTCEPYFQKTFPSTQTSSVKCTFPSKLPLTANYIKKTPFKDSDNTPLVFNAEATQSAEGSSTASLVFYFSSDDAAHISSYDQLFPSPKVTLSIQGPIVRINVSGTARTNNPNEQPISDASPFKYNKVYQFDFSTLGADYCRRSSQGEFIECCSSDDNSCQNI